MNIEVTPDLINGGFELVGAAVLWANVVRIRRDKSVKGFNPWTTVFYSGWGVWNLYYYPTLEQWLSFIGGIAILTVNVIWLSHVFYYWRKAHKRAKLLDKYKGKKKVEKVNLEDYLVEYEQD